MVRIDLYFSFFTRQQYVYLSNHLYGTFKGGIKHNEKPLWIDACQHFFFCLFYLQFLIFLFLQWVALIICFLVLFLNIFNILFD